MSRIIVAVNKTLDREGKRELDTGLYYLVEPLEEMGHEVYFYDTVDPEEPDFDKVEASFKPDLIFCCFTGNPYITPHEPWQSIQRITYQGKVKTFNWFCDDTWRFDDFSSRACWFFNKCSTPEPAYVKKYEEIGYDNIIVGGWYANKKYYTPIKYESKDIELSFVGGLNPHRKEFLSSVDVPVTIAQSLSITDLFKFYCRSKIGINLSVNANDPQKKTQMKGRVFELAAAGSTVLTEYHEGLKEFFEFDREIVTFKDVEEFKEKVDYLEAHPMEAQQIARRGRERFLKDHESKIRLSRILEHING